jgi:hypothetical protein
MRQIDVAANADGDTVAVVLDQYQAPFQVTYSRTGAGTVEVSVTDPYPVENQDFVEATYVWATAPTAYPNAEGFLGQPYRAIRLTGASEGDVLTVIQAGVKG